MKITLSIIKADVGSVGGHIAPSPEMIESVQDYIQKEGKKKGLILDYFVCHTGDDISILLSHQKGVANSKIHKLCWDAFLKATKIAKSQGLYGAGQDLLVEAFSGNVKGMGPQVAEIEFQEREAEPFLMFMADKTEPGAFNLPLYLSFADPMHCAGLILSPALKKALNL